MTRKGVFSFFYPRREKKIVLDCFTSDKYAYEYAPIIRGPKSFPEWWKKLPTNDVNSLDFSNIKNMKLCYGFVELFKRSIVIPSWTDIYYKVTPENGYTYQYTSGNPPEEHAAKQYQGGFQNYYHSKLCSPWYLRETTGVHFTFIAASWNLENYDFIVPPGCVEYRVNNGSNVNIMIPKKKHEYSFFIPTATPLVFLIPLIDNETKIELKTHLVSNEEITVMRNNVSHPFKGIFPLVRMKERENKCPFG